MKYSNQISRIVRSDWLKYHPYETITFLDNYYISLCNNVLKIIRQSEIAKFLDGLEKEKALACVLVAYFEDVISETHLFSTFTRLHKKMYGKALPFYEIPGDYDDNEINLYDIYFLIWYHISISDEEQIFDPYFGNSPTFHKTVLAIYNLFDSEFEQAPQNEKLQNILQLSADSDVKTVKAKLSFIACNSFLWNPFFHLCFNEILEEYKKDDIVVLKEHDDVQIYDAQVGFIFDECMPLLTLRANEYFAEILGEDHSEYQFIKNIPTRIFGCFLIRKIEKDGFLIEHLSSKKQIWLSNEFTAFENIELVENETVITISLVQWKDGVWQNQGGVLVNTLDDMKGQDVSRHIFDDENQKKEITANMEKAFLELTNGEHIVYMRGNHEYAEFYLKVVRKHAKMIHPKITEKKLDEQYKDFLENCKKEAPFENDEVLSIFFNPNRGMEVYHGSIVSCMPDKNNPFYANQEFDVYDLLTATVVSKEFIHYMIENKIIKLCISGYENPNMFSIVMKNFDFLLRFYQRSRYVAEQAMTIMQN